MPWTIYRYILWDLLKLLVVSSTVLVTAISFAAAIKPLSEGLLSAPALIKFVGYTAPTMLAFVLPFAGAFASTIVFLRLAADNEITAMSASGISYASILTPVFALGLVLTMSLFYLSNFVIPSFYRAAAQTVEVDLMTVLVNRLNKHQPFEMENVVLYADSAAQRPPDPQELALMNRPIAPEQMIELKGVAVAQLDESNRLRSPATAERATVWLFRGEDGSWIDIILRNLNYYDAGQFAHFSRQSLPNIPLPTPLRDQPEFLSWRQLRALRDAPERYGEIGELKAELADTLAEEQLRILLMSRLRNTGEPGAVTLRGSQGEQQFIVSAPQARRDGAALVLTATEAQPVVVEAAQPGQPPRRFEAASAVLRIERSAGAEEPSVVPVLQQAKVFLGEDRQASTEYAELTLPRAVWPTRVLDERVDTLNALDMLEFARSPAYDRAGSVVNAGRGLWSAILKLGYRIVAQLHQRAASAIACLLVLVLGALLSIRYRHQMSLVVYFWAFTLAIVTVVIIHTGTNLAGGMKWPLAGLLLIWSGDVALAILAGLLYCQVARN